MGFLKRGLKGEEEDEKVMMEEQYERLFAKIGRDFVYIDDLKKILDTVREGLGQEFSNVEARKRALEYKSLLDAGKDGSDIYEDLVDMSED